MAEDVVLQLPHRRPGFEAQFVGQDAAQPFEGPQGVGLATAPVEGQGQELPRPFPKGFGGHELLELPTATASSPSRAAPPTGLRPRGAALAQAGDLGAQPRLGGQLGVGRAPPGRPGLVQHVAGRARLPAQKGAPLGDQTLEPGDVEGIGLDLQQVPRRLGDQDLDGVRGARSGSNALRRFER